MIKNFITHEMVTKAFTELEKIGYFAKENFWCCQSCGWSAVPEGVEKVVFYHEQDNESWGADYLEHGLYLAWNGDCKEIKNILESCGLKVEHDESEDTRIMILS